ERGHIEDLAIGSDRHAIASSFELLVPDHLLGDEIDAGKTFDRADVELSRHGAGGDALDVLSLFARGDLPRGDPLDELVSLVDVVDENADAAILKIVADARHRDVEEMSLLRRDQS